MNTYGYMGRGASMLHTAASHGDAVMVKELVGKFRNLIDDKNGDRWTPLHLAVLANACDAVKLLLESGADANITTLRGYTSLHFARKNSYVATIQMLILYGCTVEKIP